MAGVTQLQLAEKTGIPRDRIAKWEQGKGAPKANDHAALMSFFHSVGISPSYIEKGGTNLDNLKSRNTNTGPSVPEQKRENKGRNSQDTIELTLAESNRLMAESNYLLAASMQTLIQTNADLTSDIRKERSANAVLGMPLTVAERFASVLKLVAKAGSHGWKTEDEALAEINKVFYAYLKQEEEADTPTAPGK